MFYRTRQSTLPEDDLVGYVVETDLDKALAHLPDGVIVANPTALHVQVALPAAQAGCAILMEKPVSNSLVEINELKSTQVARDGRILVGFQFRFHPGLLKVKELLDDGAIGRPLSAGAHWGEYLPNWHPWEDYRKSYSARSDLGGGVVLTLTHPLDYLYWLLGDVEALMAVTGKVSDLEIQVEDLAEIVVRFRSGVVASLHLDYYQQPPSHWLEVKGTQGSLRWQNNSGAVELYRTGKDQWETFPLPDGFDRNDMFMAEMRHFFEIIRGNQKPVCSLADGEMSLRLALLVHRSAREQRLVQMDSIEVV
jgi:predicted dehydrogenase